MMRTRALAIAMAVAAALAGCGEKVQTAEGRRTDAKPWQGATSVDAAYVANGWKAGDKASWEEQMRRRAQTQNEYNRVR